MVELAELTADLPPELQLSPARMQAIVRGYFNTAGLYALMSMDWYAGLGEKIAKPAMKYQDYPVMRRFAGKDPGRTKYGTEFWELYKESQQLQGTVNAMVKNNRPEIAARKAEDPKAQLAEKMQGGYTLVSELQQKIEAIYNDDSMTPTQKREGIDELRRELNKIYKEYVTAIKAQRKD